MLTWFKSFLVAPIFEGEEDKTRLAALLHMTLLATLVGVGVYMIALSIIAPDLIYRVEILSVVFPLVLGMLFLMRRGYVQLATICMGGVAWVIMTLLALSSGGVRAPGFNSYILVILFTGFLLGGRVGIGIAFLSMLSGLTMMLTVDSSNLLPPVSIWTWHTFDFFMGALLLHVATNHINEALERVRRNEQALAESNRQLEARTHELERAKAALEEERTLLALRVEERTAELKQANLELARAARLKDEFLANMSHELRTPLSTVLGMNELLRMKIYGPLNAKQEETLHDMDQSARHLLVLINDILDLSKIEAGKMELQIGPALVANVCESSLFFITQMAQTKQITLFRPTDMPFKGWQADGRRIKQILVNLLSNAVKFTPQGGQVGLEVKGDEKQIHFTVWDTGIGISAEDMKRLFQPFTQIDSGLSRQHEGTGLGLSLSLKLAQMHGGTITLESEEGQGSRFTLSLPWGTPAPMDHRLLHPPERMIPKTPQSARILLAEDNETNMNLVRDYLHSLGHKVIWARNGMEVIERSRAEQPNLILMDIQMPIMDGLEATRRLRSDNNLKRIPIIALSALAMPGDREMCLKAGVNQYLSKPIRLQELAVALQAELRGV
ncbi:MAG: ATP-binding protein [Ardenticatenaceae bacterium]